MLIQDKSLIQTLFDTDYNLWVLETVKQLESQDFESVDWENLIEEVSDLSRRDKKKLKSLLRNVFEHLLKLKYWESEIKNNKPYWEGEITNFRKQIKDELKDSPSLKTYFRDIIQECYEDGREIASRRSQLPLTTFPEKPIASLEQVLDENWFPDIN